MRAHACVGLALLAAGCGVTRGGDLAGTAGFELRVTLADGAPLPDAAHPMPLDLGRTDEAFLVDVVARLPDGAIDDAFDGFVRLSLHPGSVLEVQGAGASGRNVYVSHGQALGQRVRVTGAHGPSRFWAEDVGYVPADPAKPPACSDGEDDDGDGIVDFPGDPGCAFANDDSEEGGTYATGLSPVLEYAQPTIADAQGRSSLTPYDEEQLDLRCDAPSAVVVTRISTDGFYVTDVRETGGYGSIFAFSFSAPPGLRVCDRLTTLSGTTHDFFGFTELNFPGYTVHPWVFAPVAQGGDGPCLVPEPTLLDELTLGDDAAMERLESALVRVEGATVARYFGPKLVDMSASVKLAPDTSNCDLNQDGKIDFAAGSPEAACNTLCESTRDCSEWTEYATRGDFIVGIGNGGRVKVNTGEVVGFDPAARRGGTLAALTGTLRNFTGGTFHWTLEARCGDDLVLPCPEGDAACLASPPAPVSSQVACVHPRTQVDNAGN